MLARAGSRAESRRARPEVKGDFCRRCVRSCVPANREMDYLDRPDTGVCYNPLHNDLDPYAVAHAIGSLLNNLFGKSKEPFWQQACWISSSSSSRCDGLPTGHTTLAEVLHHRRRAHWEEHSIPESAVRHLPVLAISREEHAGQMRQARGRCGCRLARRWDIRMMWRSKRMPRQA